MARTWVLDVAEKQKLAQMRGQAHVKHSIRTRDEAHTIEADVTTNEEEEVEKTDGEWGEVGVGNE